MGVVASGPGSQLANTNRQVGGLVRARLSGSRRARAEGWQYLAFIEEARPLKAFPRFLSQSEQTSAPVSVSHSCPISLALIFWVMSRSDHRPSAKSVPSLEQRCDMRQRPSGRQFGWQRWSRLLFAHWAVDPCAVQATLPRGLYVDRFGGSAYLGIVPFAMERIRPCWFPPLPWLSWFLELNVRTYVHDATGRPGVWFYSLDCNQPLAVAIARHLFHLPYFNARMEERFRSGAIHYECQRRDAAAQACRYVWTPGSGSAPATPGSLDFFLVERYLLFAADRTGRLYSGRVHHAPYRVSPAKILEFSVEPARQAGFRLEGEPTSVLASQPVDVSIFPLLPMHPTPA